VIIFLTTRKLSVVQLWLAQSVEAVTIMTLEVEAIKEVRTKDRSTVPRVSERLRLVFMEG
jgi:hypothetical protein